MQEKKGDYKGKKEKDKQGISFLGHQIVYIIFIDIVKIDV